MPQARFRAAICLFLTAIIAVAFTSGWAIAADSQQSGSVTLAPSKIAIDLDHGKQTTIKISAFNRFQEPVVITKVDAWDFAVDESGNPTPIPAADAERLRGASGWLLVPSKPITINPGQKVAFPVIINVPKETRDGTHYTFVRATIAPSSQDKSSVRMNLELNALLLVTVGMESNPASLRRKISASAPELPGIIFKPLTISSLVYNEGNIHETVAGKVETLSGNDIIGEISLGKHTVLPGTKFTYAGDWQQLPFFGKYTIKTTFTGGPKPIVIKDSVWIFSPNMILVTTAALILLIWIILFIRRFRKNFKIVRVEDN